MKLNTSVAGDILVLIDDTTGIIVIEHRQILSANAMKSWLRASRLDGETAVFDGKAYRYNSSDELAQDLGDDLTFKVTSFNKFGFSVFSETEKRVYFSIIFNDEIVA